MSETECGCGDSFCGDCTRDQERRTAGYFLAAADARVPAGSSASIDEPKLAADWLDRHFGGYTVEEMASLACLLVDVRRSSWERGRADGFKEGLDVPHISSELTAAGDWCNECLRQTNSYTHQELCATGIAASENAREKVRALLSAQKEKP